ncbi:MAG: hypothetical protein ACKE9I_06690 [Methylophagaceae bacterium]
MVTKKLSLQKEDFDEKGQLIRPTQRRQNKRRETIRRLSRPMLLNNSDIRSLRHVDKDRIILLRMTHRRHQDRRISKPKLLSVDEIKILRRKTK